MVRRYVHPTAEHNRAATPKYADRMRTLENMEQANGEKVN
jgi:hypothetical protein